MKPIEILQGKWLGHPLHPAIVHVPIGAWLVATGIDLVSHDAPQGSPVVHLALWCVVAGLVAALVAVPTGVADWSGIKKEKPAWKLGLYHMALNLLAAIVWAGNLGLRWDAFDTSNPITAPVIMTSVAGSLILIASGWVGSLMVFEHGVSIARQSKEKWRNTAEVGGARLPENK